MGLTLYEQETIVNLNREDAEMSVYTADPALMRRLSGLSAYRKTREHRNGGKVVAMEFVADKKLLTLRGKRVTKQLTEDERAALSERGKLLRAKQLESVFLSRNGVNEARSTI